MVLKSKSKLESSEITDNEYYQQVKLLLLKQWRCEDRFSSRTDMSYYSWRERKEILKQLLMTTAFVSPLQAEGLIYVYDSMLRPFCNPRLAIYANSALTAIKREDFKRRLIT